MTVRTCWKVAEPPDRTRALELAGSLRIPAKLAELLLLRGHTSADAARAFLRPSLHTLSDPHRLSDLPNAVGLLADAVRSRRTVLVHGDYDVDGQCATALLTRVLRLAGGRVVPFVPHRLRDGYDLGPAGIAAAHAAGASLIVTCDCGTAATEAVARAKREGLQVVVTDHHLPGADLPPADAIVNPRRADCRAGAAELCGAGVAFKLVQGLVGELGLPDNLPYHFLDFVALATVADMVPLSGENRALVRFGLRTLANSRWPGLRALVEVAGLGGKPIRAGHVGYILAPRLNAVGRVADAARGLELLLTDDYELAYERAHELEALNTKRRALDQDILEQAVEDVEAGVDLDDAYGLVLAKQGWHPGVIGIVASRLVERYARPTVMIGLDGDIGKGSCRSIPGFDIHAALTACSPHLVKYGGHRMAAGLTVARDAVDAFREAFMAVARKELTADDLVTTQRVDVMVSVSQLDPSLERILRHFEPCGMGNPAPVFAVTRARALTPQEVGRNHLKFTLEDRTGRVAAIGFDLANRVERTWLGAPVDVAFRIEEHEWGGIASLQARVLDLRPAS